MTDTLNELRYFLKTASDFLLKEQPLSKPEKVDEPLSPLNPTDVPKRFPTDVPKRFMLYRTVDHSGVSGTGWVASGIEFSDGTVVVRWFGHDPSTSVWKDIESLKAIHGHNGATQIQWLD